VTESVLELLDRLFTFTFTIDDTLSLSRISARLGNLCPDALCGSNFLEVFHCYRPAGISSFKELSASDQSMFLLISRDKNLALKGQVLPIKEGELYQFVGMPWLAWMNDNAPEVQLHLRDFPKLDSQMDQEFYLTSQQSMVRELESVNAKLTQAEEDAKEASKVQSDLFAIMSHEMRTPLNGVISALSLLRDENDPIERSKLTKIANESADNLLSVINYALDYSKIDAGRMDLDSDDFSLQGLLESIIAVTEGRAKAKAVDVSYSLEPGLPKTVNGDAEKLRQVLINVVGNAIKFTDAGKVELRVANYNDYFRFIVSDTGCGIGQDDLDHIFDPFWGRSKGSSESSTGLGLNIVKRLVELMSGQITVESTEGAGTTFYIDLPFEVAASAEVEKVDTAKGALPSYLSGRVLLVDDNQTNLMLGKMILEKYGISVRTASNGKEALDIVSDVTFDLVLMDIAMPVMDGSTACQEINRLPSPPPVIALTANVGPKLAQEYEKIGFKGYLKKPLENDSLLTELNIWLKPGDTSVELITSGKEVNRAQVLTDLVRQLGEENFARVKALFLEETDRRLIALLSAWVRRDLEVVRKESHTLASSVGSFGCDDLSWRLKQIERASSQSDATEIIKYMKDIETNARTALEAVSAFKTSEEGQNE